MDRISGLSDDLLVKIISYLPTKLAVSTSILSQRWEFLWMLLPKLEYGDGYASESEQLLCFLNKNMPLHRAPVIESFRLDLSRTRCKSEDVKLWVQVAVSRQLRELDIEYDPFPDDEDLLPRSLYACKSLVTLKLGGGILVDVPRKVCLPSLKTLQLEKVTGLDGESLRQLLSICPVLETLSVVFFNPSGNTSVIVPSLQSLSLHFGYDYDPKGLEIETPSLKYLDLNITFDNFTFSIGNMPRIEEACLDVSFHDIDSLLGSIISVKRLTLCCSASMYSDGFVFKQLEYLSLCDCVSYSANLLARLLKDSPNLRKLEIFQMEDHDHSHMLDWNEPSTVPECFLSSLQTFDWLGYMGGLKSRDVGVYILKNACRLKTATFSSNEHSLPDKFDMFKELARSSRASTTCELVFY